MGEKEWRPSDVFDVIGDSLARRILVLGSDRPLSADELATKLDVSRPTVYRRVNALLDYDLLRERQQVDGTGNHFQSFETTLQRVAFEIDDGGYDIDLTLRQSLADQFDSFWTDLDASQTELGRPDGEPLESGGRRG